MNLFSENILFHLQMIREQSDKIKLENNLREYVEHINASSITSIEMFVFKYKYIQSR